MSTILVGVDASEHAEDAIAFASMLGRDSSSRVVVACGFRRDGRARPAGEPAAHGTARQRAQRTASRMSHRLDGIAADRIRTCAVAMSSSGHGLRELAVSEGAAIVVVGSSSLPGGFAELVPSGSGRRRLHGAASAVAVAVVPDGYRTRADRPIRRIGVAFDGSEESRAALVAAVAAVHAFGGELDAIVAGPPVDLLAHSTVLDGRPARQLTRRSECLDLLLLGSRGFDPLHALLADSVRGRVLRDARCPVIAVPRGADAPLEFLPSARRRLE